MVGSKKNKIKESFEIVLQALVCPTAAIRTSNRTLRATVSQSVPRGKP